jgi:hypothetical protein
VKGRLVVRSGTRGANIGYKVYKNDLSPPDAWKVYTEPIPIEVDSRIELVAHRLGYMPSESIKIEFR